ncbi:hypothetical protein ARMSODRAFT_978099 [Armillaria solidipes]|uniref:Uncharacterized protein n=1 Tax=Armillaria solidipes TaxID=1076256 RepID=A0A2H3B427_9AGAR|nr:hypothetical protein ARMSODRAFT_978099 [Armillaria solidipes]
MTSMLPRELASVDWNSAEPFTLNDVVEGSFGVARFAGSPSANSRRDWLIQGSRRKKAATLPSQVLTVRNPVTVSQQEGGKWCEGGMEECSIDDRCLRLGCNVTWHDARRVLWCKPQIELYGHTKVQADNQHMPVSFGIINPWVWVTGAASPIRPVCGAVEVSDALITSLRDSFCKALSNAQCQRSTFRYRVNGLAPTWDMAVATPTLAFRTALNLSSYSVAEEKYGAPAGKRYPDKECREKRKTYETICAGYGTNFSVKHCHILVLLDVNRFDGRWTAE